MNPTPHVGMPMSFNNLLEVNHTTKGHQNLLNIVLQLEIDPT
jgi:hypothetical protein